jgi:hypothetical protein
MRLLGQLLTSLSEHFAIQTAQQRDLFAGADFSRLVCRFSARPGANRLATGRFLPFADTTRARVEVGFPAIFLAAWSRPGADAGAHREQQFFPVGRVGAGGTYLLQFFGIWIPVVQIGGGLVVLVTGWSMLNQKEGEKEWCPACRVRSRSRVCFGTGLLPAHSAGDRWSGVDFGGDYTGRKSAQRRI